jgi:hypothetical protein
MVRRGLETRTIRFHELKIRGSAPSLQSIMPSLAQHRPPPPLSIPHLVLINLRAGLFGNRPRPTEWLWLARLLIQTSLGQRDIHPAPFPQTHKPLSLFPLHSSMPGEWQMNLHHGVSLCHDLRSGRSAICDLSSPITSA